MEQEALKATKKKLKPKIFDDCSENVASLRVTLRAKKSARDYMISNDL